MKLTHSIVIDAPKDVVWEYVDDPERIKLWMHGVEENEVIHDTGGVGTTFRMAIREGRKLTEYQGEVTARDPGRHLQVQMSGGCSSAGPMTVDYTVSDAPSGGTELDYLFRMQATGIWALMGPIGRLFGKMMIRKFFRSLKRMAEEEARTGRSPVAAEAVAG